jgi:hypothetical protein
MPAVQWGFKDVPVHATNYDWKLMAVVTLASILLSTYLTTTIQSTMAMWSSRKQGKKPPIVPYWIPFLGSVIPYLWDGPGLAAWMV